MGTVIQLPKREKTSQFVGEECRILEFKQTPSMMRRKVKELHSVLNVISTIYGKDSAQADLVWDEIDALEDKIDRLQA